MGIFVVSGATRGIGFETAEYLRSLGHELINIDINRGDIVADIGTAEGREIVVRTITERCPDGIDGLVLNAGITNNPKQSRVLSINYFGTVAIAEGLLPLLKKKGGKCVITVSGSIAFLNGRRGRYHVDELLVNCGDEERIGRLVDSFPEEGGFPHVYSSSKLALVRYVRRVAPAWGAAGVTINALAPGTVDTEIMKNSMGQDDNPQKVSARFPMPTLYGRRTMMSPREVGSALARMVLPEMGGVNGAVLYCDGGTSALLHTEKWY